MAGSVQNKQQVLPVPAGTEVPAASITGTGDAGLDGTVAPYTFLKDQNNPGGAIPLLGIAQDGTDSTAASATQAAGGVGIRGWLSTLVSLLRSGGATVSVGNTPSVTVSGTPTVSLSGSPTVGIAGGATVGVSSLPGTVAQDGTDSTAATALQATAGVGIRGWLSTLVSLKRANAAALSSVAASATSQTLIAANAARKGLLVANDSTSAGYIAYAATATSSAYTVYMPGSSGGVPYQWEMSRPVYTGVLSVISASATGNWRVTETS